MRLYYDLGTFKLTYWASDIICLFEKVIVYDPGLKME